MTMVSTQRLEAFSDGVVAILITVMVFDLKMPEGTSLDGHARIWIPLMVKLGVYAISFLMLAIMWVNHHQLLNQIKVASQGLLWYNLHLLFWMSLVPLAAHLVGNHPLEWAATAVYGLIFAACAQSFSLLRRYAVRHHSLHDDADARTMQRRLLKNRLTMALYLLAALAGGLSVYLAYACYLLLPALYFLPDASPHHPPKHEFRSDFSVSQSLDYRQTGS